ncbi:MAG: phage N-6-adenine-methyltransferase [Gammaproteobacteria bacterium]|nr:phage N-6-adenine-methyltransferase [Gammaproteobacteria bacterium]
MSMSGHQSPVMGTDEWLTPPEILAALGSFDLDPCSPHESRRPWPTAEKHYCKEDDGLSQEWQGRVWMNPPFGREATKWMRKLAAHGNGIALIPARTETAMFFESVWGAADAVQFLQGRPHFHRVDGSRAAFNSGAPICLVAYGLANVAALERSGLGHVTIVQRRAA